MEKNSKFPFFLKFVGFVVVFTCMPFIAFVILVLTLCSSSLDTFEKKYFEYAFVLFLTYEIAFYFSLSYSIILYVANHNLCTLIIFPGINEMCQL